MKEYREAYQMVRAFSKDHRVRNNKHFEIPIPFERYFLHDDLWKMLVPFDRPHGNLSKSLNIQQKRYLRVVGGGRGVFVT